MITKLNILLLGIVVASLIINNRYYFNAIMEMFK